MAEATQLLVPESTPDVLPRKQTIPIYKENLDDLEELYNNLSIEHKNQHTLYEEDHKKWVNIYKKMKDHVNILEDTLKNLKHKYTEITKKLRELQKKSGMVDDLEAENKKLKDALAKLLKQINDTNKLLQNNPYPNFLKFLEDMNNKLKAQENKWKKEKDKLQNELKKLLKMMDERITEFEQIILEQDKEIDKLKKENEDLQNMLEEQKERIRQLEARQKANDLVANASADDKDNIIRELTEYKDVRGVPAEEKVVDLTDKLDEKQKDYEDLLELLKQKEQENDELNNENERLRNELSDRDNKINELNNEVNDKNDEIERLKQLLKDMESKLHDKQDILVPMEVEDKVKNKDGFGVRLIAELGLVCAVYILVCCVFVSFGLLVPNIRSFLNEWIDYECLEPSCIDKSISVGALVGSMCFLAFFAILILILFILVSLWKKQKRYHDIKRLEGISIASFIFTSGVWLWWCIQVIIVNSSFRTTINATLPGNECGDGTINTDPLFNDAMKIRKNSLISIIIGVVPLPIILIFFLVCWRKIPADSYVYLSDKQ
mmetsp:Transcript_38259/g.47403  ORF Transcript_38259/g.47403 Transcript_38259/m.47403 type:complete len:549 (-) Transcript_38259:29-1675(-)